MILIKKTFFLYPKSQKREIWHSSIFKEGKNPVLGENHGIHNISIIFLEKSFKEKNDRFEFYSSFKFLTSQNRSLFLNFPIPQSHTLRLKKRICYHLIIIFIQIHDNIPGLSINSFVKTFDQASLNQLILPKPVEPSKVSSMSISKCSLCGFTHTKLSP